MKTKARIILLLSIAWILCPCFAFADSAMTSQEQNQCEPAGFSQVLQPGQSLTFPDPTTLYSTGAYVGPPAQGDSTQRETMTIGYIAVSAVGAANLNVLLGTGNEASSGTYATDEQTCPLLPFEGDLHYQWSTTRTDGPVFSFSGNTILQIGPRKDELFSGSTCWNLAQSAGLINSSGNWTLASTLPYGNRVDYPVIEMIIKNKGTKAVTIGDDTCLTSTTVKLTS